MSLRSSSGPSPTDSEAWEVIENCIYAFEQDSQAGEPRPLTTYLPHNGNESLKHAILVELVKVDLELQWKDGEMVMLEHYCSQYRDLGSKDQLPPDLVYEAYRVACQHGKSDSAERFCAEYPNQRQAVLALAERSVTASTAMIRKRSQRQYQPGEKIDDFELLTILGKGAFGQVFLARQRSLGRQVALKITANHGSEARTMARLEHDNIVQVFSESVNEEADVRLLCMQYIPGTTLGKVIRKLSDNAKCSFRGADLLDTLDELTTAPAIFQAGALKERETLAALDQVQTVCWIGERLSDALAHAHALGVLHRDIKPDNILLSIYGRPLLADFNLSLDPHDTGGTTAGMFGGSLAYMSPEHLDAFNPLDSTPATAVDERSDVYSLGMVLFELMAHQSPFDDIPSSGDQFQVLEDLAAARRRGASRVGEITTVDCAILEPVLDRCLRPAPTERFQSATELTDALNATRELRRIENELPKAGWLLTLADKYPLRMLLAATLLPNLLGSAVNISYNVLRIVPQLNKHQATVFSSIVLAYNLIVYPICVAWLCALAVPIFRAIQQSRRNAEENPQTRKRLVAFPLWLATISCVGWLPGGILFPLILHALAGPLPAAAFGHFAADFTISGMIVLTYTYFGVESVFLRSLYPRLLIWQSQPREAARRELAGIPWRLRLAQALAGVIPLAGAVLLVVVGPNEVTSYGMFRILVSLLIGVGMLGFCLSIGLVSYLRRVVDALTGDPH